MQNRFLEKYYFNNVFSKQRFYLKTCSYFSDIFLYFSTILKQILGIFKTQLLKKSKRKEVS